MGLQRVEFEHGFTLKSARRDCEDDVSAFMRGSRVEVRMADITDVKADQSQ